MPLCSGLRRISFALAAIALLGEIHAGPNSAAAKPPTRAEIDQLIARLGSQTFVDRDAASKTLSAIGPPAMDALRKTVKADKDLEIRRRCELLIASIENRPEQLLIDYKAYGLPLPSANAPLVRYQEGSPGTTNKSKYGYRLAFLLRPQTHRDPPLLCEGLWENECPRIISAVVLNPKKATHAEVREWLRGILFYHSQAIPFAIQCQARGWDLLAQAILDGLVQQQLQESKVYPARNWLPPPAPRDSLVETAWRYWERQLFVADWTTVSRRLKSLQATEKILDTEANRSLLRSLDAALVPSKARPGSIEALIDDLRDVSSTHLDHIDVDARYLKALEQGFAAVPHLIHHLDDDRLTRCHPDRICHIVLRLLQGIAGDDSAAEGKAEVSAWWAKAQKTGEEAYGLAQVLPARPDAQWPNYHWLRILVKKYPDKLGNVYRDLLEKHPDMQSYPVAFAIRQSGMTDEEKAQLFLLGARQIHPDHRGAALWHLMDKDFPHVHSRLLKILEAVPATPEGPYLRGSEVGLVAMVMETDDARLWEALAKLARRADLGFRMEILQQLGYRDDRRKQSQRRLDILKAYLDDDRVRDLASDPKKFAGPCAGYAFQCLQVRDMAAQSIGSLLYLSDDPQADWTAKQWAELHADVRKAIGP